VDSIDQKISEFQNQLIPKPSLLKQTLLSCPAVLPAVGLIIGLVIQFYLALGLLIWLVILILCIILYLAQLFFKKTSINLLFIIVFLCFACLGSIRLIAHNKPASNDIRNITFEDFTFAHIKASIISKPVVVVADENDWLFSKFSYSLPYTTFYAKATEVKTAAGWTKATGTIKFYISEAVKDVNAGYEIQAFCRLDKFSPPDNPGQFDTARYMNRNGVFLSASVKSANAVTVLNSEKAKSPFNIKTKLRQLAITALLDDTEPDNNMRLVEALLLGSRTKIDRKLYNDFIKTGLVHLICLSGLNVGILASVAWWLSKKVGLLHKGRSIACIIATIIFLLVVPATSPTLRAGIMFIIFCLGPLFSRQSKALNSLAISLILLLLIKPMDFLDAGFRLSFAATLGILLFNEPIRKFLSLPIEPLRQTLLYLPLRLPSDILSIGLAAWVAIVPIVAWHFYQLQLLTAVWTVPASFPATVIIILGTLKILLTPLSPTLAAGLAFVVDFSAKILSYLVTVFAKVPLSQIIIGKPGIHFVVLFYLLIFLWRFSPFRKKPVLNFVYPAVMIFLLLLAVFVNRLEKFNNLQLTVLSVGHGQAIYVKTPDNRNFIIDAGSMSKNDVGDRIVNPFLDYTAADKIHSIFISHDDIDHYNGLPEILNKHNCQNAYTTPQFIQSAATSTTDAKLTEFIRSKNLPLCITPEKISLGKTVITRLWPKDTSTEIPLSDNEASLVLLLEYAGRKILLCSDITAEAQRQLMNLYPQLDVDLIVTPHHGSGRTLEPLFLNAFKPEFLITSCSEARLTSISREITDFGQSYYTCKDGAITASITPTGQIRIKKYLAP
jgi:competence protein ComEC